MNDSIAPGAREFQTTRWSVVLAAQHGGDSSRAHKAMSELCRDYWYPLYAFVRRRGHAPHDAQDLTQAFFATLMETNATAADPKRGRFRSYLLGALKHFLANDFHRGNAQKRGGGQQLVEWDALDPEARYALEPEEQTDADTLYDRRWAFDLLDRAMKRLRAEFAAKKDESTFDALKVAIHRLRQRYREILRAEIAETVDSPGDVDDEMRHLVAVLRAS